MSRAITAQPRKGRFVHQQKDINWISIRRNCLRQETEVVGKYHAGRKNLLQGEYALIRFIGELIAAA
jgi:hypothetical protein